VFFVPDELGCATARGVDYVDSDVDDDDDNDDDDEDDDNDDDDAEAAASSSSSSVLRCHAAVASSSRASEAAACCTATPNDDDGDARRAAATPSVTTSSERPTAAALPAPLRDHHRGRALSSSSLVRVREVAGAASRRSLGGATEPYAIALLFQPYLKVLVCSNVALGFRGAKASMTSYYVERSTKN
jgi:hypothetical protein